MSVDAVAEAAGRTSGAVYAHFGSKQGLLLALLDEWAQSLVTVIAAEFELAATVEDRLRAVAANVIDRTRATRPAACSCSSASCGCARPATPRWPRPCGPGRAEAHDRLARGFAAVDRPTASSRPCAAPDVLATVFRALVVGFETQHRIDPDASTPTRSAAALATGDRPSAVADRTADRFTTS